MPEDKITYLRNKIKIIEELCEDGDTVLVLLLKNKLDKIKNELKLEIDNALEIDNNDKFIKIEIPANYAYLNTDDAPSRLVLLALGSCANHWDKNARLVGSVRAGDIVRAIKEQLGI